MRIRIICVGRIKDRNLKGLVADYESRCAHDADISAIEIKDSDPREEGQRIIDHIERIKDARYIIALSEEGRSMGSSAFSALMKNRTGNSETLIFIIGGPFGLSEEAKKRADMLLSLSGMTFTHEMARYILLEQIYRGISIIKGRKYHKE